jgi:CheY-like chemotaxis protein
MDVLVVEDNQINRFILREMLQGDGHRVTEAHDGLAGLELAAQRKFDIIFMDISMPRLDGIAATVRLRSGNAISHAVPIVALTAHASDEDRALFLASGMNAVLTKPLNRKSMFEVMAKVTKPSKPRKHQRTSANTTKPSNPTKPHQSPANPSTPQQAQRTPTSPAGPASPASPG